jgi:hypothetical protein
MSATESQEASNAMASPPVRVLGGLLTRDRMPGTSPPLPQSSGPDAALMRVSLSWVDGTSFPTGGALR